MSLQKIVLVVSCLVLWFTAIQSSFAQGEEEWKYIHFAGLVANDVPSTCNCNFNMALNKPKLLIKNDLDDDTLTETPKIELNCSFGSIDADVELITNTITKVEDVFELKGILKNSDYFSSWKGTLSDNSFDGYLFNYEEVDSIAFNFEEKYDNALNFEIVTFSEAFNVLEQHKEIDGLVKHSIIEIKPDQVYSLEDKEDEHFTYNLLGNYQKIHLPTVDTSLANLYMKLYFQTVNNQNYVVDEAAFKDSIDNVINEPLQELCKQNFERNKISFIEELTEEEFAPVMNDYYISSEIKMNSKEMLGVCFDTYSYSGGAHGLPHLACYNLDVKQEEIIQLGDIFEDGTACMFNKILKREIANFAKTKNLGYIVDLTSDCEGGYYDLDFPDSYYLTETGITMVYQVYSLFSYADGVVPIFIPANDLITLTKKESLAWNLWYNQ